MKRVLLPTLFLAAFSLASAQSAMDGYQICQPDLKGTARFMSMAGAFGALGGDLTTLSQNPGGIGVYRSNDIGFTLDLDCQSAKSESMGKAVTQDQTKFLLNNIGMVATWKIDNDILKNFNLGFTYQKAASFNRAYRGVVPTLNMSMSNYIAGISNANELTVGDVRWTSSYDPYNPNDGYYASPWISVLGYDAYLANPIGSDDDPYWVGQWGNGTSGLGYFSSYESGGIDEYNISFGGNISNVFYWGMDFGIIDLNYTQETIWGEQLDNAYLPGSSALERTTSDWDLYNYYNLNGSGFNYKLGFIVKPIQELRLGFAFHTPTWYNLTQTYYADVNYSYGNSIGSGTACTNDGYDAYSDLKFRSPWKIIASAAGVIGSRFILSADYEWQPYNGMKFSSAYNNYDYLSGQAYDEYDFVNADISNYYKAVNTIRVGAEFRVTPQFSLRAGYSYSSSPVKDKAKNGDADIWTAGTRPQYVWDNSTQYITCGLGYKYQKFYVDAAYVYKHRSSEFHAFAPDRDYLNLITPEVNVTNNNSQVVLTMGFKF